MTVSFHAIIALVLLRAWTVQSHQLTAQQTEVYSKEGWKSVKESAWEICFVHGLMMMGVLAFICLTQRYPRTARNSLFYFAVLSYMLVDQLTLRLRYSIAWSGVISIVGWPALLLSWGPSALAGTGIMIVTYQSMFGDN
jgi:hypothetical protein